MQGGARSGRGGGGGGGFIKPKDQGYGELLDSGLLKQGDQICAPGRSERLGTIMEDGRIHEKALKTCTNCGAEGHNIRTCPKKREEGGDVEMEGGEDSEDGDQHQHVRSSRQAGSKVSQDRSPSLSEVCVQDSGAADASSACNGIGTRADKNEDQHVSQLERCPWPGCNKDFSTFPSQQRPGLTQKHLNGHKKKSAKEAESNLDVSRQSLHRPDVNVGSSSRPSQYHLARLCLLPVEHNIDSPRTHPFWPVSLSRDGKTFIFHGCVGERYKVTADLLLPGFGASFKNLAQSDADCSEGPYKLKLPRQPTSSVGPLKTSPQNDDHFEVSFPQKIENMEMPVTICTESSDERKYFISFKVSGYEVQERTAQPGDNVVFDVRCQERLSPEQIGTFSVDDDTLVKVNDGGQLTMTLPNADAIDPAKRIQKVYITRQNRIGVVQKTELQIQFVKFSFNNVPQELVKDEALENPISLFSDPDQTQFHIGDIGDLTKFGFEVDESKRQIIGAPSVQFESKVHYVEVLMSDHVIPLRVGLKLPDVQIKEPPSLEANAQLHITKFPSEDKINEIKTASEKENKDGDKDFEVIAQVLDGTKLAEKVKEGYFALTLIMGRFTEAKLHFSRHRWSSITDKDVKYLMGEDDDIKIDVKEGSLVISGNPKAHKDSSCQIHESGLRFRRSIVEITPKNESGHGKKLTVDITCRPLKIFWGLAQTYDFDNVEPTYKLPGCAKDHEKMKDVHCQLGFDMIFSCIDVPVKSVERTRKHIECLTEGGQASDVVIHATGHGYESDDGSRTFLVHRDHNHSADEETDADNVCIQDLLAHIGDKTRNSTFLTMVFDACRSKSKAKDSMKDYIKLKMGQYFKQQIIWWATSPCQTLDNLFLNGDTNQ